MKLKRIIREEPEKKGKVCILGVHIDRLNMTETVEMIKNSIIEKHRIFVVVPNVFIVTECKRDPAFKRIINSADLAFADGVPLVWASYFLGEYTGGRVSGADFFYYFNSIAEQEAFSCYYLGGGPDGSELVVHNLKLRHPNLRIVGNFSPELGELPEQLTELITQDIDSKSPDILWVGLGSPRQEKWIYNNLSKLNVKLAIGVGAAFDYEAGKKRRAPRWMHVICMEWFYRILIENPALLWRKRYYAYLWEFIIPVVFQVVKRRLFSCRPTKGEIN